MLTINNWVKVFTATIFATIVALAAMMLHVFINYPADIRDVVRAKAALSTAVVAFPMSATVFMQMLKNYRLSEELRRLVNRDRLTDVATRDFFFRRMEADAGAYGVSLMIDIDLFKQVNDTYGHLVGDDVIKHVSTILQRETRERDIVCRFGGEEFVVFLHEADGEEGLAIAERIRAVTEQSQTAIDDVQVSVTVSIGGSIKERLEDINVSIKLADEALYRAKSTGRNRIVVDWEPANPVVAQMSI